MTDAQNNQMLAKAKHILKDAGLLDVVTLSIEEQPGETSWGTQTVLVGCYEDVYGNSVHTEKLDQNLTALMFTEFFTQRSAWIKAPHSQKADAMDKGIHPAFFTEEYLKVYVNEELIICSRDLDMAMANESENIQ